MKGKQGKRVKAVKGARGLKGKEWEKPVAKALKPAMGNCQTGSTQEPTCDTGDHQA